MNSLPGTRRSFVQSRSVDLRRIGGEEPGDLHLQRVGVLELVDEDAVEPALRPQPHVGSIAQQIARPRQKIVERSLACVAALRGAGEREVAQVAEEIAEGCRALIHERRGHLVAQALLRMRLECRAAPARPLGS